MAGVHAQARVLATACGRRSRSCSTHTNRTRTHVLRLAGPLQVTVALSAGPTAYSHDPKKAAAEPPLLPAGGSAALVSLAQARNNARAVVAGSLDMFSNELYDAEVQIADGGERCARARARASVVAGAPAAAAGARAGWPPRPARGVGSLAGMAVCTTMRRAQRCWVACLQAA